MSDGPIKSVSPDWNLPRVRVLSTLRLGGGSRGAYASLNLARHVGDDDEAVTVNRRYLRESAGLPAEPLWLNQVHGQCVALHEESSGTPTADAAVSFRQGRVCAVMTADCLPLVLTDRDGSRVAVVHAGWRGLAGGIIAAAVRAMRCEPDRVLAWLGPAISQAAFEVGPEVRDAFVDRSMSFAQGFEGNSRGRFQADLCRLARIELAALGVLEVSGGHWCTFQEPDDFFSYRRDGRCGRMATLAWLL
jgi:YfiH family protein